MSLRSRHAEVLDATEHIPVGATLVIDQLDWADYEHLLAALDERPHLRVSYDCGRLEILSPSRPHEHYARLMDLIVFAFCEARRLRFQCFGQTTWRRESLGKGVEADACYYIKSVGLISGRNVLNVASDPPPDIAVEIDLNRSSARKLFIYAALSISEVWRYDGRAFQFYSLAEGKYVSVLESRALPGMTASMLSEVMEACKTGNPLDVIPAFRRRLRKLKP